MKLIEACRVAPADPATKLTLPLTFLDLYYFNIPPTEDLFFYSVPGLDSTRFNDSVLVNLKHSLALTLAHYLPLAGNLIWPPSSPKPVFHYRPSDAVSLSVSKSASDFEFLSWDRVRGTGEARPLVPSLFFSHERASVIAMSITLFPGSGFCIGLSYHHSLLDLTSINLFLKSWAHICKELANGSSDPGLSPELSPVFDRTAAFGEAITGGRGLDMGLARKKLSTGYSRSLMVTQDFGDRSNDLVLGTFVLTRANLENLRNRAMKTEHSVPRLSTFVLSAAYVLSHNLRAVMLASTDEQCVTNRAIIGFPVDYRTRLGVELPANYVGNCAVGQILEVEEREWTERDGFARLAVKMSEMIKDLDNGVLPSTEERLPNMGSYSKYRAVGITGYPGFRVYGLDFGFGELKKVVTQSNELSRSVSITESRDGSGGVEFTVVLTQLQMQHFQVSFQDGINST